MSVFLVELMAMVVLLLVVFQTAMSSGAWIHIKLYCSRSRYIFIFPVLTLLANTLIITGFGNVQSQALLETDSTQSFIFKLLMAENVERQYTR